MRQQQFAELFVEIVLEAVDVAPCRSRPGGADPVLIGERGPEAMRDAADGKPTARRRSTASGRKSGMPLFLNQLESLSLVMFPDGSVDIRGAWAASMIWVLPVTVWRSWFQVNSATSWSRHMRVSREAFYCSSSGSNPRIAGCIGVVILQHGSPMRAMPPEGNPYSQWPATSTTQCLPVACCS